MNFNEMTHRRPPRLSRRQIKKIEGIQINQIIVEEPLRKESVWSKGRERLRKWLGAVVGGRRSKTNE